MNLIMADIGGTNARVAYQESTPSLKNIRCVKTANFSSITEILQSCIPQNFADPKTAMLALAGPDPRLVAPLTNAKLTFSGKDIITRLNLDELIIINDYTAISLSIPNLKPSDTIQIKQHKQEVPHNGHHLVVGAGTGLGVSAIIQAQDKWTPISSEAGHIDFAAHDNFDINLWNSIPTKYSAIIAEELISGIGIENLYKALNCLSPNSDKCKQASEISSSIEPKAQESIDLFFKYFGRALRNLSMVFLPMAGIYIGSGIIPKIINQKRATILLEEFTKPGEYQDLIDNIPIYIITHNNPGLLGILSYLNNKSKYILSPLIYT